MDSLDELEGDNTARTGIITLFKMPYIIPMSRSVSQAGRGSYLKTHLRVAPRFSFTI